MDYTIVKPTKLKDDGRDITGFPINTWDQVRFGIPIVSYHRETNPRSMNINHSTVWMRQSKLHKEFPGKRAISLPAALAWASEKFNVRAWMKNGMGDYLPADAAVLPLREQVEQQRARQAKR